MMASPLSAVKVIDTDSHVVEPADLWTSRVSSRYGDAVPQVAKGRSGRPRWRVGDKWLHCPGLFGQAGWPEYPPQMPETYEEIDPGSFDPVARLERMDEYGVYAQVLYPNLIGFETTAFMALGAELSLVCTRAYNDFLIDFASADPKRLLPIAMVPFWDIDEAPKEIARCREIGHRGILFANQYEKIGLPPFFDPYWDPIYRVAEDLEMSVNFHIGFASDVALMTPQRPGAQAPASDESRVDVTWTAKRNATLMLLSNGDTIANILTTGVLDRFPTLKFVSVESGMGYLPYLLESLDWHWKNHGAFRFHPLLPSEYFKRQCLGTFWFETSTLVHLVDYPDSFMFETDYPHNTGLSPGPTSPSLLPSAHVEKYFSDLPFEVAEKALWGNAAALYGVS
jgi:predicted TIM-barrel fold metal-dependent hydrolase